MKDREGEGGEKEGASVEFPRRLIRSTNFQSRRLIDKREKRGDVEKLLYGLARRVDIDRI